MNAIKNLLIICVLGAVGYGMYQALSRTNVDPEWPVKPKAETSGAKGSTSPGGSLALSGNTAKPSVSPTGLGTGTGKSPFVTPSAVASNNSPNGMTNPGSTTPYAPSAPTGTPTPILPQIPPSSSTATLGQPVPPDAVSAMPGPPSGQNPPTEVVHNLAPPPETSSPPVVAGVVATAVAVPTENPPFGSGSATDGGIGTAPAATNSTDVLIQNKLASFMKAVQKSLDEGKYAEAHLALSTLYGYPDLPGDLSKQITDLLDQLAGTVIYSRQHYLEPAYKSQPGDTLEKLGQKFNVPWELLARINGLVPPGPISAESTAKDQPLPDGMELKVVRGPFNAVINLQKHELTLMVQNRYAGRFPIGVGRDQPKLDGEYTVCNKTLNPPYIGSDGVNINPRDPKNPLGSAWIGLTDQIGIHGTNDPQNIGRDDNRGTICVKDRDLQDLFGILSVGSRVTVVR